MTARSTSKPLHLTAALSALALTGAILAGCAPSGPEPTPTSTAAFASEEEAFAAAEEVYRAYNDAVNEERAGIPDANPERFLTGDALESYYEGQEQLRNQGITVKGETVVVELVREEVELKGSSADVTATACRDVSDVRGVDLSGIDITPPDRPALVAQIVMLAFDGESFTITTEAEGDITRCALGQ